MKWYPHNTRRNLALWYKFMISLFHTHIQLRFVMLISRSYELEFRTSHIARGFQCFHLQLDMDAANHCLLWAQAHRNSSTHMLLCIQRCCTYHWCVICHNMCSTNPLRVHIQAHTYAQGEACLVPTTLSGWSLSLSTMYVLRLQISSFLSLKLSSTYNKII